MPPKTLTSNKLNNPNYIWDFYKDGATSNLISILKDEIGFSAYIPTLTEKGNWKDTIQTENYELLLHYGLKNNCIYVNTKNDFKKI